VVRTRRLRMSRAHAGLTSYIYTKKEIDRCIDIYRYRYTKSIEKGRESTCRNVARTRGWPAIYIYIYIYIYI